jgi:EpsI family protein
MRVSDVRSSLNSAGTTSAANGQRLRVWHVYWIGGEFVLGDIQARIRLSINRLMGKGDDAAVLIFYTPMTMLVDAPQADAVLQAWVAASLPSITEQLKATHLQH